MQERALATFHFALAPGGYLFLGASETAEGIPSLFVPIDKKHRIYARRATIAPVQPMRNMPRLGGWNRAGRAPRRGRRHARQLWRPASESGGAVGAAQRAGQRRVRHRPSQRACSAFSALRRRRTQPQPAQGRASRYAARSPGHFVDRQGSRTSETQTAGESRRVRLRDRGQAVCRRCDGAQGGRRSGGGTGFLPGHLRRNQRGGGRGRTAARRCGWSGTGSSRAAARRNCGAPTTSSM